MVDKRDLAVLQFIAVVVILITASWPGIRQFLSHVFPYGEVAIPAVAFVFLFHGLFFIYTRYLWKLHPDTAYLGGQWIYTAKNEKKTYKEKTDDDPASSDKHSQSSYGIFEVRHTADKLLVRNGKVWDCKEPPDFDKIESTWESVATIYLDRKLVSMGNVTADDFSQATQFAALDVIREKSKIGMDGKIWAFPVPDGVYYGSAKMKRIDKCSQEEAAQKAYKTFGCS